MAAYALPNDWEHARRRLRLLEQTYDHITTRHLTGLGGHPAEGGPGEDLAVCRLDVVEFGKNGGGVVLPHRSLTPEQLASARSWLTGRSGHAQLVARL